MSVRVKYYCGICSKLIKNNTNAIGCDFCGQWSHPKCNLLDSIEFSKLSKSNEAWSCLMCNCENFPFQSELLYQSAPNPSTATLYTANEPTQIFYCKYYESTAFNNTLSKALSNSFNPHLSFFQLNTCSLLKNIDEVDILLHSLDHKFDILGFTETRLRHTIR